MAETIVTGTINKQVYDMIRKKILEREYLPGDRIDPKKIAEDYGISMMPVRDALRNLSTDGLVITRERIGFFVRSFGPEEVKEVYEARMMYELYCLRNHMEDGDPEELEHLYKSLEEATDRETLVNLDLKLHGYWIKASGNTFLQQQYQNMNALFALGVQGGYEGNLERARKEHMEIIRAVQAKDKEKAIDLLYKHLDTARVETMEIYSGFSAATSDK